MAQESFFGLRACVSPRRNDYAKVSEEKDAILAHMYCAPKGKAVSRVWKMPLRSEPVYRGACCRSSFYTAGGFSLEPDIPSSWNYALANA
jgi:hypothetical protein